MPGSELTRRKLLDGTCSETYMMDDAPPTLANEAKTEAPTAPAEAVHESSNHSHRSALLIVFLVVFIDLLGFGIVLPLLPLYADELLEPLFPAQAGG